MNVEQILKIALSPDLLSVPAPSLPSPANWVIPFALYGAIVAGILRLLRSPDMVWGGQRISALLVRVSNWLSRNTAYPYKRPLGELICQFSMALVSYLFAIYFFLFGFCPIALGINALIHKVWLACAAYSLLGLVIIVMGRIYHVNAERARIKLIALWSTYRLKRVGFVTLMTLSAAYATVGGAIATATF